MNGHAGCASGRKWQAIDMLMRPFYILGYAEQISGLVIDSTAKKEMLQEQKLLKCGNII